LENITKDFGIDMTTDLTVLAVGEEFDFATWMKEQPKKELVLLKLPEDPVALACASYRIWLQTNVRWTDLETTLVTAQDRIRASELRKYYAGRMTFDVLKGGGLNTAFRKKLYAIATNCHEYTKEDIGLLHRLPYFYEEDLVLDSLALEFKSVEVSVNKELHGVFTLHKKMLQSRRAGDYYHYWLKQQGSEHLYKIAVKYDDSLRSLVESLLEQPRQYTATAYYKGMQGRRAFNYIQLGNMKLV